MNIDKGFMKPSFPKIFTCVCAHWIAMYNVVLTVGAVKIFEGH